MTTIVFDGKTLACDSQVSSHHRIVANDGKKIFTPPEGEVWRIYGKTVKAIGISGDYAAVFEIIEALKSEKGLANTTAFPEKTSFSLLSILEDGKVLDTSKDSDDKYIATCEVSPPVAIGSGMEFALGAMAAGLSAEAAVDVAIQLDLYSGGPIQSKVLF